MFPNCPTLSLHPTENSIKLKTYFCNPAQKILLHPTENSIKLKTYFCNPAQKIKMLSASKTINNNKKFIKKLTTIRIQISTNINFRKLVSNTNRCIILTKSHISKSKNVIFTTFLQQIFAFITNYKWKCCENNIFRIFIHDLRGQKHI